MNDVTLADVFNAGFEDYAREQEVVSVQEGKIARAIMNCRTDMLGGMVYHCESCNTTVPLYHSCRSRYCPTCQAKARSAWVEKREKEMLDVPYVHIVFTVPSSLKAFALRNRRAFYDLMFRAVSQTLLVLGKDSQHLGGKIGIVTMLHTWTQTLEYHPHIHCIVPAGALSEDGIEWIAGRPDFLFPVNVVKALYRGKFLALFRTALRTKDIDLHGIYVETDEAVDDLLDSLYRKEWVVFMKESITSPVSVVKYLAAYTNRIAISNARIKAVREGKVSFTYIDRTDHDREKLLCLSVQDFIRRFFLHLVPPGFVRIRYYGFLSNRGRSENIEQCRLAISGKPRMSPEKHGETETPVLPRTIRCPSCGGKHLKPIEEIPKRLIYYHRRAA